MKQTFKTKLSPQLCVFLTAKASAQDLQSTLALVNHNSLYNDFSLSHFTCLKCHKKSILLHQVRACNQFVWLPCFNGKAMCVSVCKLKETGAGLNSTELCSSILRIL